jgi:hypothetical protein
MIPSECRTLPRSEIGKIQSFDGITVVMESFEKSEFRIIARYSDSDYSVPERWDEKEGRMVNGCFLAGYHSQQPEWMITNHVGVYYYFDKKRIPYERFLEKVKESRRSDFLWLLFHPEVSFGIVNSL